MVKIEVLPTLTLDRTDLTATIQHVQVEHSAQQTLSMSSGQPKTVCRCGQAYWSIERHISEEIAEATTKWFTENIGELVVQEGERYRPASAYEEGIMHGHARAASLIHRLGNGA